MEKGDVICMLPCHIKQFPADYFLSSLSLPCLVTFRQREQPALVTLPREYCIILENSHLELAK